MNNDQGKMATDLLQAKARLAIIANMAKSNLERCADDPEVAEIMQSILATCTPSETH